MDSAGDPKNFQHPRGMLATPSCFHLQFDVFCGSSQTADTLNLHKLVPWTSPGVLHLFRVDSTTFQSKARDGKEGNRHDTKNKLHLICWPRRIIDLGGNKIFGAMICFCLCCCRPYKLLPIEKCRKGGCMPYAGNCRICLKIFGKTHSKKRVPSPCLFLVLKKDD